MGKYQMQILASLWALAVIVSFNTAPLLPLNAATQWSAFLANICAVILLARTESIRCLQVSIFFYLLSAVAVMPSIPNHRMVLVFAGIAILLGTLRNKQPSSRIIANVRWLTIIVYVFAVLAKCNRDYLQAEASCATRFFVEMLELHGIPATRIAEGQNTPSFIGYWSLIVEFLIPVFLLPVRTRGVAVVVGILFHICLATHYTKYFANFSTSMFLLLSVWLSEEQCQRIEIRYVGSRRGLAVFWVVLLYSALFAHALGAIDTGSWMIIRYALWLIFSLSVLRIATRVIYAIPYKDDNSRRALPNFLFVLAAIVHGVLPYLGIKTRSAFSMYSNLRVEPGYSNHIVMPPSVDLAGYLSDTVSSIETTDSTLSRQVGAPTERLPYIALCAYLAEMDNGPRGVRATVSYEHNGQRFTAERGGELPQDCPPWVARKFLLFGPIGPGSERGCIW